MKASDLVETTLDCQRETVVVELANGQRIPLDGYRHDTNERGEPIIVLLGKGHPQEGANT